MTIVFRVRYLQGIKSLLINEAINPPPDSDMVELITLLYQKDWIVWAKQPFGGLKQVIEYLGRYTPNHDRLSGAISHTDNTVAFDYKDYADQGKQNQ